MAVESIRNRDLFMKICFIYFLNHILIVLGINEKITDIKPTEYITRYHKKQFRILDNLLDFVAATKSGRLIIFEFKKNSLTRKDLKQVYLYYRCVCCKEKMDAMAFIIVMSKKGKISKYTKLDVTYHPQIIKTKEINKQKDLINIRNKFETMLN